MKTKQLEAVQLGDQVIDEISGLKGVAIGRCEYLYGCTQIGVQPKVDKDGSVPSSVWIDEQRVKFVSRPAVPNNPTKAEAGGSYPAPKMSGRR